jgi:hypothetical protein
MVIVYLGAGLLLLFYGHIDWLADKPRKGVGIAMVIYGAFRAFMVWQKRKQTNSQDDH